MYVCMCCVCMYVVVVVIAGVVTNKSSSRGYRNYPHHVQYMYSTSLYN